MDGNYNERFGAYLNDICYIIEDNSGNCGQEVYFDSEDKNEKFPKNSKKLKGRIIKVIQRNMPYLKTSYIPLVDFAHKNSKSLPLLKEN